MQTTWGQVAPGGWHSAGFLTPGGLDFGSVSARLKGAYQLVSVLKVPSVWRDSWSLEPLYLDSVVPGWVTS